MRKRKIKKNPHVGSSFEEFLEEAKIRAEVEMAAAKRVLAWRVQQAMREKRLTKSALAKAMNTSRAAVDRLIDPENLSVTLHTISRAAAALGKHLRVELEDHQAIAHSIRSS